MGLDTNGTKFLLYAKKHGLDFSKTAMIGRQFLYLSPEELASNLSLFGDTSGQETIDAIFNDYDGYSEGFLKYIGAKDIHSFDNAPYENATHIHDMNNPIPDEYKNQFSVVIDGGSLEHIFNFPTAIKNCIEMLKVGGYYLGITPANNFLGHGFYQFSPELYFRIFSEDNGFEIDNFLLFEDKKNAPWYSVKDPKTIGKRVTLTNSNPTYLLILAKKIRECEVFSITPQQSDYVHIWNNIDPNEIGSTENEKKPNDIIRMAKRMLPKGVKSHAKSHLSKLMPGPKDHFEFFEPFDPNEPGHAS